MPATQPFEETKNTNASAASLSVEKALVWGLLAAGFLLRFGNAAYRFLNADEALHYLLSIQPSLPATYRASLTTVHPPLLILFLHYWGMLNRSELFLRLPAVLAGTVFCWVMFYWLQRIADGSVALIGLALLLFSPALVQVTSEVRQYAFLLLFCAGALYFFDRAVAEESAGMMLASSVSLCFAMLTHYSALLFAFTLGIYALLRVIGARPRARVVSTWVAGQAIALALVTVLYATHISKLRATHAMSDLVGTYLRRSVPLVDESRLAFIARSNLRLFHYIFSQGAVGVLALLLFICGVVILIRSGSPRAPKLPSSRQLAFLFVFPLVVNCGLGLTRVYPYGGTRHNAYLTIFAIPAIAIALSRWKVKPQWLKPAAIATVLLICNFFPTPQGEYIRARDQNRKLMSKAVGELSSLPAGSTIFTDDQGGLLLSYYLCESKVAQIEQSPFAPFLRSQCGEHWVISIDPDWWIFKADAFSSELNGARETYGISPGTPLWLFQSGWFIDKEWDLREELKNYGCSTPHDFGRNMFVCKIVVNGG